MRPVEPRDSLVNLCAAPFAGSISSTCKAGPELRRANLSIEPPLQPQDTEIEGMHPNPCMSTSKSAKRTSRSWSSTDAIAWAPRDLTEMPMLISGQCGEAMLMKVIDKHNVAGRIAL